MTVFTRKLQLLIWIMTGIEFRRSFPRFHVKFMRDNGMKNLEGVEIGVLKGTNAESLLKTLDVKKLWLIDPYANYEGYDYRSQNHFLHSPPIEEGERIARKRMEKWGDKIEFVKKPSFNAVNDVPDRLDFVYLDGNHDYEAVRKDMQEWWPKIRRGGILAGHDICWPFMLKAVSEFIVKRKLNVHIDFQDWVIVKK